MSDGKSKVGCGFLFFAAIFSAIVGAIVVAIIGGVIGAISGSPSGEGLSKALDLVVKQGWSISRSWEYCNRFTITGAKIGAVRGAIIGLIGGPIIGVYSLLTEGGDGASKDK